MSEQMMLEGMETTRPPLDQIKDYLEVLCGEDLSAYEAADGMLDDVLYENTGSIRYGDSHTSYVIHKLVDLQHSPTHERELEFNNWRKFAAAHVVRGAIQGGQIPTDQFGEVIDAVLHTMAKVDGQWEPTRKHKAAVRRQIVDVWSFERNKGGDPVMARRAAEAFKFVGRPRSYGRMMTKVARKERRQDVGK